MATWLMALLVPPAMVMAVHGPVVPSGGRMTTPSRPASVRVLSITTASRYSPGDNSMTS